jgi:hypothetical protein
MRSAETNQTVDTIVQIQPNYLFEASLDKHTGERYAVFCHHPFLSNGQIGIQYSTKNARPNHTVVQDEALLGKSQKYLVVAISDKESKYIIVEILPLSCQLESLA